jgi:hypothetical protein
VFGVVGTFNSLTRNSKTSTELSGEGIGIWDATAAGAGLPSDEDEDEETASDEVEEAASDEEEVSDGDGILEATSGADETVCEVARIELTIVGAGGWAGV